MSIEKKNLIVSIVRKLTMRQGFSTLA